MTRKILGKKKQYDCILFQKFLLSFFFVLKIRVL